MTWGDPNSAAARAVARRARKGLDTSARRRVLTRGAKNRHTKIRVNPSTEDEELNEQNDRSFLWRFR
jgi:hypothetical protein